MAMGRPTTYDQEVVNKAWEYANGAWRDTSKTVPSIVGMCRYINRSKSIVYDWAKDPEKDFSDILSAIMETQEDLLKEGGLIGDFNSTIAKLFLTKHGYSDKQEIQQDTRITFEQLSDEDLERIANGE
jgi:hypothetical protein